MHGQTLKSSVKMRKTRNIKDILKKLKKYSKKDQEFQTFINTKLKSNPGIFSELQVLFGKKHYNIEQTEIPTTSKRVRAFLVKPKYVYRVSRMAGEPNNTTTRKIIAEVLPTQFTDSPKNAIKIYPQGNGSMHESPDIESSSLTPFLTFITPENDKTPSPAKTYWK